jgi:hypothetical protein
MKKNYTQRLEKLKKRRLDDQIQKAVFSESFSDIRISESVKYALESMSPINPSYTKNTYVASEKIKNNLTKELNNKGLTVVYRHQGSVETDTHIKLHSDIDILVFTEKYHSMEPPLTPLSPYKGDPLADLKELRQECYNVLNSTYNQVDNSKAKSIQVFPTNPKRKVDVVPANWVNTQEYQTTSNEKYRGVHIYDKDNHSRQKDFPFMHIANVKVKNVSVNGGLAKLVRLLKTLKVDADYEINLSSFEITSIVYDMENHSLNKPKYQELLLLNEGSRQLDKVITNKLYRESLKSPNGKEIVFGTSETKIVELIKLKLELDELIEDITEELGKQFKRIDENIIYG